MTATAAVQFRPAVRESVGLWINVIGGTGSGKTFSALRLASGIAGEKRFAFIDTENRRGLHYADQFDFDYTELTPPFRPAKFAEAVHAADRAGYPVIVVDSASLVWSGDGGILDWHEEEMQRMGGKESSKMAAWIKPKMEHKKMVTAFLGVRGHLILCLRAEEKIEMVKVNGKTEIRAKQSLTGKGGWIPICDKALPFEATCSFLLHAERPGVPDAIKLQEQHKGIFPTGHLIDENAGKRLAQWAAGGSVEPAKAGAVKAAIPSAPATEEFTLTPPDEITAIRQQVGLLLNLKFADDQEVISNFLKGRDPEQMMLVPLQKLQAELAAL